MQTKETTESKTQDLTKLKSGRYILRRSTGSKRVFTVNNEPSMTDQSFAEDCDINNIMDKFTKTGELTHIRNHQGQFADVSEIPDLQESLNIVTKAQQAFDILPAEIRYRFGNSPVNMVEFLKSENEDDIKESIKLGLRTVTDHTDHTLETLKQIKENTKPKPEKS